MDINSRKLLVEFDKLLRNTNPELEFDTNINTDTIFLFCSMAQEYIIAETFLVSPDLLDNINAIQKRSDVLRNIIKRGNLTNTDYLGEYTDNGVRYKINFSDYWIYTNGVIKDSGFSTLTSNVGSDRTTANLRPISHNEAANVTRDIYDEPILEDVPVLFETSKNIVLYFDKEKYDAFDSNNAIIEVTYLAYPPNITTDQGPSLPEAMWVDIVKRAVEDFVVNYKYKLGNDR